jgi:hypothetical protein
MEPIKINLSTPVKRVKHFNVVEMEEHTDELLIKLDDKECFEVHTGQRLTFMRVISEGEGQTLTLSQNVTVLSEDENHIIHTTLLPKREVALKNREIDVTVISGITSSDSIISQYRYHILETKDDHHIYPQDLLNSDQEVTIKDYQGNTIATFAANDVFIPLKRSDRGVVSADCITKIAVDDTCGKNFEKLTTYRYDFLPEKESRTKIAISGFSSYMSEKMVYLETKFNPFYYYELRTDENGDIKNDAHGNPIKFCHFYTDQWWSDYENLNEDNAQYIGGNANTTNLICSTYYWNVNLGLTTASDENTLGESDGLHSNFTEKIEESLVPDIIDMERVKYSPMTFDTTLGDGRKVYFKWINDNLDEIYTKDYIVQSDEDKSFPVYKKEGDDFTEIGSMRYEPYHIEGEVLTKDNDGDGAGDIFYYRTSEVYDNALAIATSITFSFHFRERKKTKNANTNTLLTSGYVYSDGWYIDPDNEEVTWWNDYTHANNTPYREVAFSEEIFNNFMKNKALTSDLMGYLNFIDKDIYYRKKKVKQSFIRLSFYNDSDPITQKLLFYSTIFLDSNSLYGKYLKQLEFIKEHPVYANRAKEKGNENAVAVFCNTGTPVDSQIVVTNEYDRTKSSEGFNLYLFAEDRNYNIEENGQKTIYMKVEFNHAGNGKTIPMIMWPKKDGKYVALTRDNFLSSLYIPVQIAYINKRYVYFIEDAYRNENGNIDLVLFEPKITHIEDNPIDGEN